MKRQYCQPAASLTGLGEKFDTTVGLMRILLGTMGISLGATILLGTLFFTFFKKYGILSLAISDFNLEPFFTALPKNYLLLLTASSAVLAGLPAILFLFLGLALLRNKDTFLGWKHLFLGAGIWLIAWICLGFFIFEVTPTWLAVFRSL